MDTEIDWQRELDASIGSGDDLPAGHYVAAGHRAVRRRRITAVVAGIGAAAVVAGVAWAVGPAGTTSSGEAPIATDPSATSTPTSTPTPPQEAKVSVLAWRKGDPPARSGPDGLQIRKGAVVHELRNDLHPGKSTESVALDISYRGERWWMSLEWDDGGSAMSSTRPEDGLFDTFDAFVRAEEKNGGMTSEPSGADDEEFPYAGLVDWVPGSLTLAPGVVVVQEVPDPMPSDTDSIGLALRSGGEVTWMLITASANGGGASYEKAEQSGWTTFGQWLSEQVALQEGEPGLRLVTLDDDGTVSSAQPSVEVLDQQSAPDLSAYGTDVAKASAVALVDWHGERWFVLLVRFPDEDAVTTFAAAKAGGAETLDEFVAFAADRADEGGLR